MKGELSTKRNTIAQWFGLLAGPLAMLGNLQAQYALTPWACRSGSRFALHIPPILFLSIALAAAILAHVQWRRGGGGEPGAETGILGRARFLGVLGIATSLFFGSVIAAMWLADVFLNTCDGS
jgi:hypothetical protein